MSDPQQTTSDDTSNGHGAGAGDGQGAVETPELVNAPGSGGPGHAVEERQSEAVEHPAKVMRIGSMIKLLLEEVRQSDLDEPSRDRLRDIYETSVHELSEALSPDLREELGRLAHPFAGEAAPSEAELRVAKAQLVGWLEGLFHGIQATLFAQQMAARQQLEEMRRRLPPGASPSGAEVEQRPGTYL
ncbi:MAG TPA: bacterial proteasome activator family protein [Acidimicrobiales bacterium]